MDFNHSQQTISWLQAYRCGLSIAINHKIFTLLAFLAILCERSLSLFTQLTGISMLEVTNLYMSLWRSFAQNPFGGIKMLSSYQQLYLFLPVAIGLFMVGMFIFVGIHGLLRDLLLKQGYQVHLLFKRGHHYFWRVLRFKAPIYLGLSLLLVVEVVLISRQKELLWILVFQVISVLLFGLAFFIASIFLSIGPKIIMTQEVVKVRSLYACILKLIRPFWISVLTFYFVMLMMVFGAFVFSAGLWWIDVLPIVRTCLSIFMWAFLAVIMTASSFSFYLQMAPYLDNVSQLR